MSEVIKCWKSLVEGYNVNQSSAFPKSITRNKLHICPSDRIFIIIINAVALKVAHAVTWIL